MQESFVEIQTPAGKMDAFMAWSGDTSPLVVVFMDIWGLRETLFDTGRELARAGYNAIVPNLYYRHGRIRFDFRDRAGRMLSIDRLPPEDAAMVRAQMHQLTDDMVAEDVKALLALGGRRQVGAVGYCMGGRHAIVAAHHHARIAAAASLHGTHLVNDSSSSPHLLGAKTLADIYAGFGAEDPFTPPEVIRQFSEAMAAKSSGAYSFEVHAGVGHGYSLPDRDVYNAQATALDWTHILRMFGRRLLQS